jgi:hypothetical protein
VEDLSVEEVTGIDFICAQRSDAFTECICAGLISAHNANPLAAAACKGSNAMSM